MNTEDILLVVLFVVVVAIFVWEMVYLAEMKRGYFCEYKGHKIEFKMGFGKAMLLVDGQECDRQSTVFKWVLVLKTQIEDEAVELRMTTAIFKPLIKLFIGTEEYKMQKNIKGKKNVNK